MTVASRGTGTSGETIARANRRHPHRGRSNSPAEAGDVVGLRRHQLSMGPTTEREAANDGMTTEAGLTLRQAGSSLDSRTTIDAGDSTAQTTNKDIATNQTTDADGRATPMTTDVTAPERTTTDVMTAVAIGGNAMTDVRIGC